MYVYIFILFISPKSWSFIAQETISYALFKYQLCLRCFSFLLSLDESKGDIKN